MESNGKKIPEGLLDALHNIKEEDLKFGGVINVPETGELIIEVPLARYEELMKKATKLDLLTERFRATEKVEEEVVRAVTGLNIENEELIKYRNWWHEECSENINLKELVENMRKRIDELTELTACNTAAEPCTEGEAE